MTEEEVKQATILTLELMIKNIKENNFVVSNLNVEHEQLDTVVLGQMQSGKSVLNLSIEYFYVGPYKNREEIWNKK